MDEGLGVLFTIAVDAELEAAKTGSEVGVPCARCFRQEFQRNQLKVKLMPVSVARCDASLAFPTPKSSLFCVPPQYLRFYVLDSMFFLCTTTTRPAENHAKLKRAEGRKSLKFRVLLLVERGLYIFWATL